MGGLVWTEPKNSDAIIQSARSRDQDRYLAALLAPAAARDDLIILAAFAGEIGHLARQLRDPMLAEIRLRWWRDGLADRVPGQSIGHPVADAFGKLVGRRDLPKSEVDDFFEAQAHRLYAASPIDDAALDLELRLSEGLPFRFAARILGIELTPAITALIDNASRAFGFARLGLDLPYALQRGRSPLPPERAPAASIERPDWRPQIADVAKAGREALAAIRGELAHQPRVVTTALLPVALVEPYFKALEKAQHEPTRDLVQLAPLARVWRLACAHWLRRI